MTPQQQQQLQSHTDSGIRELGELAWGSHCCHFYRNRSELVECLVPFFEAGLRQNERCLWVTASPFPADEAVAELGKMVPNLQEHLDAGRIVIRNFDEWYGKNAGGLDVSGAWLREEESALAAGYAGLRASGNVSFLTRENWQAFMDYEYKCNGLFPGRRIIAFCSYDLLQCRAMDVIEIVRNHRYTIDRRDGRWQVVERDHQS